MEHLPAPNELVGDSLELGREDSYLSESYHVTSHDGASYAPFASVYFDATFYVPEYVRYQDEDEVREYLEDRQHIVDKFLAENFDVDNNSCTDAPIWELEFYPTDSVTVGGDETVDALLESVIVHSDIVRFINEMDPGTFGAPYTGRKLTEAFEEYDAEQEAAA